MAELTNEQLLEKTLQAVTEKLEKVKGDTVSKAEYEALKTEIEKVKGMQNTAELEAKFAEKIKGMEKGLFDMSAKLEAGEVAQKNTFVEKLKSVALKFKEGFQGKIEIEKIKGVGTMTFGNSITGQIPQATREAGVNLIPRQTFVIEQNSSVANIEGNTVEWVEETAGEGGAAMTGEGLTKSQSDTDYRVQSSSLKKATVFVKISKEMIDDISFIMEEIRSHLLYKLGYLKETQLFSGSGLTVNAKGITEYAQPLDLAAVQNSFALNASNRWDAIGAAVTQIKTNMKGMANPNTILLSPADYYLMVHGSKSTSNEYVQPITISPDGAFYNGIRIQEHVTIPAGFFLVADMTKYNVRNKPLEVIMGTDGNDFTNNLVTIIAEQRFLGYVKANDVEAFVYESFADAKLFLERNT